MSLCLIVDAAEPEEWLEAGWFFPGTGWCIYTQGERTCFYTLYWENFRVFGSL